MPLLIPDMSLHEQQLLHNVPCSITAKVLLCSNHCSFLLTTKSYFKSVKYDVEVFLGVGKGFSAPFYLLTAEKGLLTISESKFYQNMLTKKTKGK